MERAIARSAADRPGALLDLHAVSIPLVEHILAAGPPLIEVHQQVLRVADLDTDEVAVWQRRVKQAAILPHLQLGYRQTFHDTADFSLKDSVSVTSAGVVIGPRTSNLSAQDDRHTFLEVRATWALNELLFTPQALQVSQEARHRRDEARALLARATQLYGDRQQLLIGLAATKHGVHRFDAAAIQWRLATVTGELDALTQGWFSRAQRGLP